MVMDQDTLFRAIFFGGLYGVSFVILYVIGRKASPSSALQFSIGGWVAVMLFMLVAGGPGSFLLFFVILISSLFVFRKKADNSFQQFFIDNRIYKAAVTPEQVAKRLGTNYYSCAEGTLTSQSGEDVHFNWWQGMISSMVKSGNAYVNTSTFYLAISFAPNVVSNEFKQVARAKADTSGFTFRQKFKRFFVLDTETPIWIDETEDGSFVIAWQTYHDLQHYAYYLNWLTSTLSGNGKVKPAEKVVTSELAPILTSEIAIHAVVPSSRQKHEQALGQPPVERVRGHH